MSKIQFQQIFDSIRDRFSLKKDQEREHKIIEEITRSVEFRGVSVWILIFAIMLASIGLNMNSTAVVIGAMLISPLMGPIMGIGLGAGMTDWPLIRKSALNFLAMVVISIVTSAIYFEISPLQQENSELLGRTSPTTWDVFIGIFGGLAGIMAASSREKGNVIPGVAIATALMPPLCTAGYGLAIGSWKYFSGAFLLFVINAVFIGLSTLSVVRLLNFKRKEYLSPEVRRRARFGIAFLVLLTVVPSLYVAQNLIQTTSYENHAREYVEKVFVFPNTEVVKTNIISDTSRVIVVSLLGDILDENTITNLRNQMEGFQLRDVDLVVKQGQRALSAEDIKLQVLETYLENQLDSLESSKTRINYLTRQLVTLQAQQLPLADISRKAHAINNELRDLSIFPTTTYDAEGNPVDTLHVAIMSFTDRQEKQELDRLSNWLKEEVKADSLRFVVNQ